MKKLWQDRRFIVSMFSVVCLTVVSYFKGADVAAAISTICLSLSAANAAEGIMTSRNKEPKNE